MGVKISRNGIRKTILTFGIGLGILGFLQILTILFLQAPLRVSHTPFSGSRLLNPYAKYPLEKDLPPKKASLHLHSDAVWYTPERHAREDIEALYRREGFSFLSFSDYHKITKPISYPFLSSFEWGVNLRKRHVNVIGLDSAPWDFFPFYATLSNLEWSLSRMKASGGFVVINHPTLNKSFTKEDLRKLLSYDAIEVFSPFGDAKHFLDVILSQGKFVRCMASDDLHYFAETEIQKMNQTWAKEFLQRIFLVRNRKGKEVFKRFLLFPSFVDSAVSLQEELKSGNYFCVKKHFAESQDPPFPRVEVLGEGTIAVSLSERALEIKWIGENGKILQVDPDTNKATFRLPDEEPYVRLEISTIFGVLVSNAIVRSI